MNYIMLLLFSLLISNLLLSTAQALLQEKIVGGDLATAGLLKYQVAISGDGEYECAGAILGDKLIASATHCIVNEDTAQFYTKNYKVIITNNFLIPNEMIASALVEKIYLPKDFDIATYSKKSVYELDDDLLLLKLKTGLGITSNPLLQTLRLPIASLLSPQDSYIIAGHGVHNVSEDGTFLPKDGKLRYAKVEIISNEECSRLSDASIPNYFLCAQVKQIPGIIRGTCRGDSGAPLVQNDEILVGILILNSITCSEAIYPSAYMNISHYSAFIENAMKGETSEMSIFSLIGDTSSGYSFKEESSTSFHII